MKLPEKLEEVIEDFKTLETNTEKYEELLQYGEELEDIPTEFKTKENLVPGCTSVVYIKGIIEDDRVKFYGSSDSYLVKGLVAILVNGFAHMKASTFIQVQPNFLIELGLTETLSSTRANASVNIFNMMKEQILNELNKK